MTILLVVLGVVLGVFVLGSLATIVFVEWFWRASGGKPWDLFRRASVPRARLVK